MRKTCSREEFLELSNDISELSDKVLTRRQIEKAEKLSIMLVQSEKSKNQAIEELLHILPIRPKRPLSCCRQELKHLPRFTRDAIKYLGNYIDLLVKWKTYDLTKNPINLRSALGNNIDYLKNEFEDKFVESIRQFSRICVNAQHTFDEGKKRYRFTPKEVVHTVFIVANIGNKLIGNSDFVKHCIEDGVKTTF